MTIEALTVGPIVGWTRDRECRVWGRGDKAPPNHRTTGVARIRRQGDDDFGHPVTCKMLPVFDYTGVIDFGGLQPGTRYEVEFGYVHTAPDGHDLPALTDWSQASKATFKTDDPQTENATDFVFGSCRYLLKLFGGTLFDERGDRTFRSIREQIAGGVKTDFMLMVGDQIYADDLNVFGPDRDVEEFFARYREVFGQRHIREMMAHLPTYMILDDHEIRNDWSNDDRVRYPKLYACAMHAYQCYQLVHGPAFIRKHDSTRSDTPDKLWYSFDKGRAAFFVTDTRTERTRHSVPPEIVSRGQMDALKTWLAAGENRDKPKFVVSSVPVFPDSHRLNEDKWQGYEAQRAELLDFILENQIKRVVFLSGDIHCSLSAQLGCSADPDFRVTSIISSSLFWPYPQGQASTYRLRGTLTESKGNIYTIDCASPVLSEDNFTRIQADGDTLQVSVYGRKGADLLDGPLTYRI